MRITRIFEDLQGHESHDSLSQDTFVELLARHKALLLKSDNDNDPWSSDDFARFVESLGLTRYEYVGGAGRNNVSVIDGCESVKVFQRFVGTKA